MKKSKLKKRVKELEKEVLNCKQDIYDIMKNDDSIESLSAALKWSIIFAWGDLVWGGKSINEDENN